MKFFFIFYFLRSTNPLLFTVTKGPVVPASFCLSSSRCLLCRRAAVLLSPLFTNISQLVKVHQPVFTAPQASSAARRRFSFNFALST